MKCTNSFAEPSKTSAADKQHHPTKTITLNNSVIRSLTGLGVRQRALEQPLLATTNH
ncbi:hypothetical protein EV639_104229 [Rathayibacter tanaceti]|uniref:Uncharacterized protein n=2 Tax=Rathayibacter tanaceti TaxID=1671680 RepID=A0ACD2XK73_9MICO|nr:hypothetical protein ACH61_01175 [Rathayibacter tanaceti]TCO37560.1 hypothetical protein EV639_104229 [Rathayibacter tanaceti]